MAVPDQSERREFVPALGISALTRFYDNFIDLVAGDRLLRRGIAGDVVEALEGVESPRVLEVGCGTGSLTLKLAGMLPHGSFTGVDIDPKMLAMAERKAGASAVEWLTAPADELPLADASFDAVTISLVMHHLSPVQQPATLAEILRVLRPGGSFHVLDFGRPRNIIARVGSPLVMLLDGRENTTPIFSGGLAQMIDEAGFTEHAVRRHTNTPLGTLERQSARKPS